MKLVVNLAVLVLLAVLGTALYLFSGAYDVAAVPIQRGFLEQTLARISDKSVERHAAGIRVPPLNDPALIQLGAAHYRDMCVTCHGAPGVQPAEIGQGLNPHPPNLVHSAGDMAPNEIYWVAKNGIKMTGMPAFGPTHDERDLWAMVAFIEQFPKMTPEAYQAAVAAAGPSEERDRGAAPGQPGQPGPPPAGDAAPSGARPGGH
jgi:mono/diheme cytochrome c family protein